MKKILILLVITILQSVFCSFSACELEVGSHPSTPQLQENSAKNSSVSVIITSDDHHKDNTAQSENRDCTQCEVCFHSAVVQSPKIEITFQSNDFFSSQPNYRFHYLPPFLSFSQKPPKKA